MDKSLRNTLRNVVTQCRKLLEESIADTLEGQYGVYSSGQVDDASRMTHLQADEQALREHILVHLNHIKSGGFKDKDAVEQLIREAAFTHLNRLAAYKMMEKRGLIRETVSRGVKSQGLMFYLADHPDDEHLYNGGKQDVAYRHFLTWQGEQLSSEIGVLFSPHDLANGLFPPQRVIDEVLTRINSEELQDIWGEDEAIGWIYQYFTPKELRDKARAESQAPRNSYELAFRNQFFTPRYVVEFLTDNTLGRIWYEMRRGETALNEHCRYLVRRPVEIFLNAGEPMPEMGETAHLPQEELLQQPVYIPHRARKDPRGLRVLDPACGSGHFLLYCFDLLAMIYEEAYADPDRVFDVLRSDFRTQDALRRAIPGLILANNLHGIDIDPRATQIAALALWLRAQRYYQDIGLKRRDDRPTITRSNIVCAEPMPGDAALLDEFTAGLNPPLIGNLVKAVFNKMKLAGEAGSLLKIEEELADAITAARKQFETGPTPEQLKLFPDLFPPEMRQQSLFDFSGIDDLTFFEGVEKQVLAALEDYARQATNGRALQRELFADDAVRGFAFIDLCRKRYDVILMNPPFGSSSIGARAYISLISESYQDLSAVFVERWCQLLSKGGHLGAITTRTVIFIQSFDKWRNRILSELNLSTVADLGYGVLDAMVETAMYVVNRGSGNIQSKTAFISLLSFLEKDVALTETLNRVDVTNNIFWRLQTQFQSIPSAPLAYWIPESLLSYFDQLSSFNKRQGSIRQGIATADDFRFLRLRWEVPIQLINTHAPNKDSDFAVAKWAPIAKGGEYSPWWYDLHLVVLWHKDGEEIRGFVDENGKLRSRPQNLDYFFRPGLTYSYRTTSAFSLRCLPSGCTFSHGGWGVYPPADFSFNDTLAIYNSRVGRFFMEVLLGQGDSSVSGSAARNHGSEAVGGIPWPKYPLTESVNHNIDQITRSWRLLDVDETTAYYVCSSLATTARGKDFDASLLEVWLHRCKTLREIGKLSYSIDQAVVSSYGLPPDQESAIAIQEGNHPESYPKRAVTGEEILQYLSKDVEELVTAVQQSLGSERYVVKKAFHIDRYIDLLSHLLQVNSSSIIQAMEGLAADVLPNRFEATEELISYSLGVIIGRWNINYATGEKPIPELPDPFAPLPACPPGMLQGDDGLPLTVAPQGYPVEIQWDGVLVDDEGHPADVVGRVRQVIELLWGDGAESIEREACDILGVKSLRDYFRKPGKGGFWDDHIKRYSKSRRQAPIYWLLQSSKRNYALWLYYHRLDKDILYKALVNTVEPKLRLEEARLADLRGQSAAAGNIGAAAKRLAGEVEKQEELMSELYDFRDRLKRAADLNLEPDLNDGVVLNIAPLHELVPWKVAGQYWDELLEGKYEWSSISQQLRARGIVS